MTTRMKIEYPAPCPECDIAPTIYKVIGIVNTYKVECDRCGIKGKRFELVEDAVDYWDNAPMERLLRSLKTELLPATGYVSLRESKRGISYYLMDY